MPPDRMMAVLQDLHLSEVSLQVLLQGPQRDSVAALQYREILAHHGLSTAEFAVALDYYNRNPRQFSQIYDTLLVRLELLELEALALPDCTAWLRAIEKPHDTTLIIDKMPSPKQPISIPTYSPKPESSPESVQKPAP